MTSGKKKANYEVRFWERQFLDWKEGKGQKPGPHPDPDHQWNTHPEMFDVGEDEYGDEY